MARLPSITSKDQVAPKDHAIVDGIVQSRGALQGPFTMFLHCPELAGRLAHLGAFVRFEGSLDVRVGVLAAMTVARELDAVYVWGAQTGGARRLGDDGLIQLTGAIGYYSMLSMTVNACELEAGKGAEVLQ